MLSPCWQIPVSLEDVLRFNNQSVQHHELLLDVVRNPVQSHHHFLATDIHMQPPFPRAAQMLPWTGDSAPKAASQPALIASSPSPGWLCGWAAKGKELPAVAVQQPGASQRFSSRKNFSYLLHFCFSPWQQQKRLEATKCLLMRCIGLSSNITALKMLLDFSTHIFNFQNALATGSIRLITWKKLYVYNLCKCVITSLYCHPCLCLLGFFNKTHSLVCLTDVHFINFSKDNIWSVLSCTNHSAKVKQCF